MKLTAHAIPASRGNVRRRANVRLTVQYGTRAQSLPSEKDFGRWVRAAVSTDARVTVRLVGLAEGRTLNRVYRGRDYATNVLTFVLDDRPPYDGDLAICAPVVRSEARARGLDLTAHYAHLTVHGILHLQGYDHEREPHAAEMEKLETRILKRLGYPDPHRPHLPPQPPPIHGRHSH